MGTDTSKSDVGTRAASRFHMESGPELIDTSVKEGLEFLPSYYRKTQAQGAAGRGISLTNRGPSGQGHSTSQSRSMRSM